MNSIIVVMQGPSMLAFAQDMDNYKYEKIRKANPFWAGMTRAWIPQQILLKHLGMHFNWYWYTSKSLGGYRAELSEFLKVPELVLTSEKCYSYHKDEMEPFMDKIMWTPKDFEEGGLYNGQILCAFAYLMTLIKRGFTRGRKVFILGCDMGAGGEDHRIHSDKAHDYQGVLKTLADEMNRDQHNINHIFSDTEIYNVSPHSTLNIFPKITHDQMGEWL